MLLITQSGRKIDPQDIKPSDVCLEDIAYALSNLCRFAGHTHQFYSVGQHSLRVAAQVSSEHKLQALLHDATEAYLVDLPTPVKILLPEYAALEAKAWHAISRRFNVPVALHREVKEADALLLTAEMSELLGDDSLVKRKPEAMPPGVAFSYFMREFYRLTQ